MIRIKCQVSPDIKRQKRTQYSSAHAKSHCHTPDDCGEGLCSDKGEQGKSGTYSHLTEGSQGGNHVRVPVQVTHHVQNEDAKHAETGRDCI